LTGVRLLNRRHQKQIELKHAVELNKLELDRLKSMDEFKARFYSYVTHEFKTPLTILLNLTGRIQTKNTPPELDSIKAGISPTGRKHARTGKSGHGCKPVSR
jgi:signal transduction histidine kinase